jgi:hypothetical protein
MSMRRKRRHASFPGEDPGAEFRRLMQEADGLRTAKDNLVGRILETGTPRGGTFTLSTFPAGNFGVAIPPGRREWVGFQACSLDDFIAAAIERGAPPPSPVVYRGIEGVMLGAVLAVPWNDGVLAGPPDSVGRALDRGTLEG